ncbi:hypothetical protein PCE1_001846 [Barthelona sp. PCE]
MDPDLTGCGVLSHHVTDLLTEELANVRSIDFDILSLKNAKFFTILCLNVDSRAVIKSVLTWLLNPTTVFNSCIIKNALLYINYNHDPKKSDYTDGLTSEDVEMLSYLRSNYPSNDMKLLITFLLGDYTPQMTIDMIWPFDMNLVPHSFSFWRLGDSVFDLPNSCASMIRSELLHIDKYEYERFYDICETQCRLVFDILCAYPPLFGLLVDHMSTRNHIMHFVTYCSPGSPLLSCMQHIFHDVFCSQDIDIANTLGWFKSEHLIYTVFAGNNANNLLQTDGFLHRFTCLLYTLKTWCVCPSQTQNIEIGSMINFINKGLLMLLSVIGPNIDTGLHETAIILIEGILFIYAALKKGIGVPLKLQTQTELLLLRVLSLSIVYCSDSSLKDVLTACLGILRLIDVNHNVLYDMILPGEFFVFKLLKNIQINDFECQLQFFDQKLLNSQENITFVFKKNR